MRGRKLIPESHHKLLDLSESIKKERRVLNLRL